MVGLHSWSLWLLFCALYSLYYTELEFVQKLNKKVAPWHDLFYIMLTDWNPYIPTL